MLTSPELVAYIGRLMFERRLTDISGGNVSTREGDSLYISPRYAGHRWHWQLEPGDIVSGPIWEDGLIHNPAFSREGLSHLAIYHAYPEVNGIIHAHPLHVLPFCAAEKPIYPVLVSADKYGVLNYHDPAPPESQAQADSIVRHLEGKRELMATDAAAVLMPRHGILIAGADLWAAVDALDLIDQNAWCILTGKLIEDI
jgi:L-fuculose-phosphate aldolase